MNTATPEKAIELVELFSDTVLQKVYQNIKLKKIDLLKGEFELTNMYDFTNLNKYKLNWEVKANGLQILTGAINDLELEPHLSTRIYVPLDMMEFEDGVEYFINFVYIVVKWFKGP